jgi:putative glutamine amidotransferase
MSMKPRVAIPLPISTDLEYNRMNWQAYADSVLGAGAEPIEFTLDLSLRQAAELAATCQAVLLPGSPADVNPETYGQPRDEATAPTDQWREVLDRLLLEQAYATGKPILCVCYGIQLLNVFHGGTLIQDLAVMPVNHSAGRSVAIAHSVNIASASLLASLVDPVEAPMVDGFRRLPVNSSHHQAIGIPGSELRITARCPQDAVVEAVEGPYSLEHDLTHFVLGVQWHPERSTTSSATSRAIFSRLTHEAAVWHGAGRSSAVAAW